MGTICGCSMCLIQWYRDYILRMTVFYNRYSKKEIEIMRFTKMHGLGNDYVYVNCFEERVEDPEGAARYLSDRHTGVGSDGLILICPSQTADFEMRMYNADGSRGEMCGNGIRCVGKYVYDYGLTDKTSISVETLGGIKYLDLTVENGRVSLVRVNMGKPELRAGRIPIICEPAAEECVVDEESVLGEENVSGSGNTSGDENVSAGESASGDGNVSADGSAPGDGNVSAGGSASGDGNVSAGGSAPAEGENVLGDERILGEENGQEEENDMEPFWMKDERRVVNESIVVDGMEYRMTGVSMGNPHAVVFLEDIQGFDMEKIGPKFEKHERFPRRINTEFVRVVDRETIEMRVWERGSGETMACGTGACAAAVAGILNGLAERRVTVKLLGGDLLIEWEEESGTVYMTGPAVTVYSGEIEIPCAEEQRSEA